MPLGPVQHRAAQGQGGRYWRDRIGRARVAGQLPSVAPTMGEMKQFRILSREGEEMDLRGITMCAASTVVEAIGKDAFGPYFVDATRRPSMASRRETYT